MNAGWWWVYNLEFMEYPMCFDFLEFPEKFLLSVWVTGPATPGSNNSVITKMG